MSDTELEELFGITQNLDIPASAQRDFSRVGVIDSREGGFPSASLSGQPGSVVRAALQNIEGPMVSRWGHILLRRALASRLETPDGMRASEFAALRARVLNRLGEPHVARALLQDVDTRNYSINMATQALGAALGTGDITAICPVARRGADIRDDAQWRMAVLICTGFSGDNAYANRQLNSVLNNKQAPEIDVLLAQRYAGLAGEGRRAVNIEWDGVNELTTWRWGLASALGIDFPDELAQNAAPLIRLQAAQSPAVGLARRASLADFAAQRGVLSSSAAVDLFSQVYADNGVEGDAQARAETLRRAYVADTQEARVAAIRELWGEGDDRYGGQVLTAYAAARITPSDAHAEAAAGLIASMLSAGLDRNAMRWGSIVNEGTEGWALLALAQPDRESAVDEGAVDDFIGDAGEAKGQMFAAGLAGLGRLDVSAAESLAGNLGLTRETRWSRLISQAGEYRNGPLVAMLAGLGMQSETWDRMTPRHLFHIVRALDQAGLSAEARMIAAEAVARS
ncbi:hypothetical protein VCJ71_04005 [Alteriqipengyuania sp. WL0013]|uniref:hypothetical protein n=1 Tax=Alteriqipengyuania sp. WL0013 TaxID=3110773 RepID=UPI002BFB2482|nr:hypothetical protein [Alteriqipengyuania sp. WL0013]MEB3415224.1 hypothetical protein [Alteriqipengyuania sp. WL0013]